MSITLKNIALQVRSKVKEGDIIAQGLTQASAEIDALNTQIAPFLEPPGSGIMNGNTPSTGFRNNPANLLEIDRLQIRSLTARFDLEDCPDIQYFSTAGYNVPLLGRWMRLSNTSGGSLTLTSTPTVALAVSNGQKLELFNVSANNIVIQDNGTLAGSKLRLQATTRTLKQGGSISMRWNTDLGFWYERSFSSPV